MPTNTFVRRGALALSAFLLFSPPGLCQGRLLVPGGAAVGVSVATSVVTVVGVSPEPAGEEGGLLPGDIIEAVDGSPLTSASDLRLAASRGRPLRLTVLRNGQPISITARPRPDGQGGLQLGVWVRDGAAGIGTLTYYDPASGAYGALGHAVTDENSQEGIAIAGGELLTARIRGVRPSRAGDPGELLGTLGDQSLGTVEKNTPFGVFGGMTRPPSSLYPQGLEPLPRSQAHEGPATLISTVDEAGPREFACQIVSLRSQSHPDTRSFLIRVIDPALIALTGGIVQGMSGSPVLQDGKLLGAVTHVCLNDPQCGYGVYIDWMLAQSDSMTDARSAA